MIIEQSKQIISEINRAFIGKNEVIEKVLMTIYAGGHVLLEDCPGVGKTTLAVAFSRVLGLSTRRIQFTPDTLPSDITGFTMWNRRTSEFEYREGAANCQLLLADEINRTPPKTQSALLEAMEEQQVSADGKVYPLPEPFFVLATQNPIEQEGTYQLPEAQQDRFMFSLRIDYPDFDSELRVMCETTGSAQQKPEKAITAAELIAFQNAIRCIPVPESVAKFAVRLVRASRPGSPEKLEFVEKYVKWGAGPRACQYLALAGKALAALDGRFNVSEEDILKAAPPVMRHRLLLNFRAKSEGVDADRIIQGLVKAVR